MEEKNNENYELVEVPTQTTLAVKTPSGEVWDINRAVVEILNKVREIEKAIK